MTVSEKSIRDVEFWREFFPTFHIENKTLFEQRAPYQIDEIDLDAAINGLKTEGYFHLEQVLAPQELEELQKCVLKVNQHLEWPIFALVYDEFWHIISRLSSLCQTVLGPQYWILPAFWIWHLDPQQEQAGWKPHRDFLQTTLRRDNMPNTLTIWIPFTDTDPLNGCIYVVPAPRDKNYPHNLANTQIDDFRDIRAIPAKAGAVLGWNSLILHWGGRSSIHAKNVRMSFAFELQRGDIPARQPHLLRPSDLPDFNSRLHFIGKEMLRYQHMYQLPNEMKEIAEALSKLPTGML